MNKIMFRKEELSGDLTAMGRNGETYCHGLVIDAWKTQKIIDLCPINSKGDITNCRIRIPCSAIPEILQELSDILMRIKR